MAEALVSSVVEQLFSIMAPEVVQEVRRVTGVEDAVRQLTSNLTAIQAVLADAETKQVRDQSVRVWLEKLRDVAYDIEDVLDDWKAAILNSQSNSGDEIGLRRDLANKIKELNERLDRIAHEKDRYQFVPIEANPPIERSMTTSMIDKAEVTGREEDKNAWWSSYNDLSPALKSFPEFIAAKELAEQGLAHFNLMQNEGGVLIQSNCS